MKPKPKPNCHGWSTLVVLAGCVLAGCGPKYISGSTLCSTKSQCPSGYFCGSDGAGSKVCFKPCTTGTCASGYVCSNDGVNTVDVCLEKSSTGCATGESYYCKQAGLCWSDPVACSTITNCGTAASPDYLACTTSGSRPDCATAKCAGGSGGASGKIDAGAGGAGGGKIDGGVGDAGSDASVKDAGGGKDALVSDAGLKDASTACATTCSTGQQCLGGQCCATPAAGGECNHDPSCGCSSGKICYPSNLTHAMACMTGNNLAEGADCSSGATCQAGVGCFDGLCQRYCNSDTDCPLVGGVQGCLSTRWSDTDAVIPGVKFCARVCDPAHPQSPTAPLLACPAGFNCQSDPAGVSYCFKSSPLPSGSTCTSSQDCSPGSYCTVGGACNRYCLGNLDCPNGQTCQSFSTAAKAGSFAVGYCGS